MSDIIFVSCCNAEAVLIANVLILNWDLFTKSLYREVMI